MTSNNIRYLYDESSGMELIFCNHSSISYPLHNHVSVLTIGIILNGSVTFTIDQETRLYRKNDTFTIFPYVPHSISPCGRYTLISLCIDKNVIRNCDIMAMRKELERLLTQTLSTQMISQRQILQLSDCLAGAADSFHRHCKKQILYTSRQEIADLNIHESQCAAELYIHDLKRQLELYPECRLTIEEMARGAFISKYHFIRRFKAQVGLTPHQFQLQNRIRKAQRLIHSAGTITEVALTTGFCDQSHFIKQFKKQVGLPPLTYKSSSKTMISRAPA